MWIQNVLETYLLSSVCQPRYAPGPQPISAVNSGYNSNSIPMDFSTACHTACLAFTWTQSIQDVFIFTMRSNIIQRHSYVGSHAYILKVLKVEYNLQANSKHNRKQSTVPGKFVRSKRDVHLLSRRRTAGITLKKAATKTPTTDSLWYHGCVLVYLPRNRRSCLH